MYSKSIYIYIFSQSTIWLYHNYYNKLSTADHCLPNYYDKQHYVIVMDACEQTGVFYLDNNIVEI